MCFYEYQPFINGVRSDNADNVVQLSWIKWAETGLSWSYDGDGDRIGTNPFSIFNDSYFKRCNFQPTPNLVD